MALQSFEDPVLSLEQAAEFLTISPQTLLNWRVEGRGPRALKIGSRVKYRLSQLERFLAECEEPEAEAAAR
jgi:predicted DNA-binding transcriptional regulator AlpA